MLILMVRYHKQNNIFKVLQNRNTRALLSADKPNKM